MAKNFFFFENIYSFLSKKKANFFNLIRALICYGPFMCPKISSREVMALDVSMKDGKLHIFLYLTKVHLPIEGLFLRTCMKDS